MSKTTQEWTDDEVDSGILQERIAILREKNGDLRGQLVDAQRQLAESRRLAAEAQGVQPSPLLITQEQMSDIAVEVATENGYMRPIVIGMMVTAMTKLQRAANASSAHAGVMPLEAIRYVWRWAQLYAEKIDDEERYKFMCDEIDKVVKWVEPQHAPALPQTAQEE